MYSKQVRNSVAIEKELKNLKEKFDALEKENASLKKRSVSSTPQILSTRIHNLEEELREVRKENISLKEEKTNSEKVILLMKQVEELKKENSILKDILNDPEK
jgi:predicted nuclease with TOPRIM domain